MEHLTNGILENWPAWFVTVVLIVAAVIDGKQLKVPNWLTLDLSSSSSSAVHWLLVAGTSETDSTSSSWPLLRKSHLLKHLISVLFGINLQSLCQDWSPYI